ncbi:MOSC domain-containing protein [Nonomuraea sp. NPDC050547]|uniref:MOSC domain-containing protein n=1 Tax=unclassified Nonomuraea TaxID=2593643 RepID=UPI0037A6FE30
MSDLVGVVGALRRYPVKSMLGEDLDAGEITERGLSGDRVRAVVDVSTGKVASAKNPRLWRDLLTLDGVAPPGDAELSRLFGREVRLADTPPPAAELERSIPEEVLERGIEQEVGHTITYLAAAAPGTFFDFAPLHLITTSTVRRIGELSARGQMEAVRYRPNLVIDTPGDGFPENTWAGARLRLGAAELEVIAASPRCAVPTLAHGGLPRDTDALRTVARHNRVEVFDMGAQPCAGVYARVLRPGDVRVGDEVRLTPAR